MPSKRLIAAAEAAHGVSRFGEFGLRLDGRFGVDGRAVMARVRGAHTMLRNKGLLHVYADSASRRFLGAEMIGPDAGHIGHLLHGRCGVG